MLLCALSALKVDGSLCEHVCPELFICGSIVKFICCYLSLFGLNCIRKLVKHPSEVHIRILKFLSKYIKDQLLARKFVDIVLPLLAARVKDSGEIIS